MKKHLVRVLPSQVVVDATSLSTPCRDAARCAFYASRPPTDEGITGVTPSTNAASAIACVSFLSRHYLPVAQTLRPRRAMDIGAGTGRGARDVLRHFVDHIYLLEAERRLLDVACCISDLKGLVTPLHGDARDEIISPPLGLDLCSSMGLLMYLSDEDVVRVLKKCLMLAPYVFLEEDFSDEDGMGVYFEEDGGIYREPSHFSCLFEESGATVVAREVRNRDADTFPIGMMLLSR